MTGSMGPRVGCGAAILDGNRLLLVKRLRDPEGGHWGLPGGKVDWMEPVPAAVCREIEEELGIRITLDRLLCVADLRRTAPGRGCPGAVGIPAAWSGDGPSTDSHRR